VPRATVFCEHGAGPLPVRLVAIHFDQVSAASIRYEQIESEDLLKQLHDLNEVFLKQSAKGSGGIFYQRVVTVCSSVHEQERIVPVVYLIKPDQVRYWTRSIALRDADEIGQSIWQSGLTSAGG
jgi:hypothetical protein